MDDNRYFKAALAAVVLFILGVVLKLARPVLIPFILAVFLSFIIDPALTFLTRCRCPRPGAVLIARHRLQQPHPVPVFFAPGQHPNLFVQISDYPPKMIQLHQMILKRSIAAGILHAEHLYPLVQSI